MKIPSFLLITFAIWSCGGELPTDNGNMLKKSANINQVSDYKEIYTDTMRKIKGIRMIDVFYLVPPNVNRVAIEEFLKQKCDSVKKTDIWKNNPRRRSIHLRVYKSMEHFEDERDEKYVAILQASDTQYSKNETPIIDFNKK